LHAEKDIHLALGFLPASNQEISKELQLKVAQDQNSQNQNTLKPVFLQQTVLMGAG
jgi:hypothetical protein